MAENEEVPEAGIIDGVLRAHGVKYYVVSLCFGGEKHVVLASEDLPSHKDELVRALIASVGFDEGRGYR